MNDLNKLNIEREQLIQKMVSIQQRIDFVNKEADGVFSESSAEVLKNMRKGIDNIVKDGKGVVLTFKISKARTVAVNYLANNGFSREEAVKVVQEVLDEKGFSQFLKEASL